MVAELRAKPGKNIAIFGGGELFRSLLASGLVDRIEVASRFSEQGTGLDNQRDHAGRRLVVRGIYGDYRDVVDTEVALDLHGGIARTRSFL